MRNTLPSNTKPKKKKEKKTNEGTLLEWIVTKFLGEAETEKKDAHPWRTAARDAKLKAIKGSRGMWSADGKWPATGTTRGEKFRLIKSKDKEDVADDDAERAAADVRRIVGPDAGPQADEPEEKPKEKSDKSTALKIAKAKEVLATNPEVVDELSEFLIYLDDGQIAQLNLDAAETRAGRKALTDLREALKSLSDETKKTALTGFAIGLTYDGRPNSGAGKNKLGYLDVKTLQEREEYLLESYDDYESVKKFVDESRNITIGEDFVRSSFSVLPKGLQSSLKGKGKVGDAGKGLHFLGYERKDGTITSDKSDPDIVGVVRGNTGTMARGLMVWRMLLEQGFRDPYTGLSLDLSQIDLEHVVAFDNKDAGEPSEEDYKLRENDNNFIICATNINQKKSNLSMEDFYNRVVRDQYGKDEEDFKSIEKVFDEANTINETAKQLAPTFLSEGILRNSTLTPDLLSQHFDEDDTRYTSIRDRFRQVASTRKDKAKAAGLKSGMGKNICQSMGLTRGLSDKSGRRTQKFSSDNVYRGFLLSMASAPIEDRPEMIKMWARAIQTASDPEVRTSGRGQEVFLQSLVEQGAISKEVQENPRYRKFYGSQPEEPVSDSIRPLLRSLIIRELDRIKNGN